VTATGARTGDVLAAAAAVGEVVSANAAEAESIRRLPAATVDALVGAGLMRLCVPAVYGGPEVDPMTLVAAIETVSVADGAAGWCTMIASTTSSMSVFLEPDTASEIYGEPDVVSGGVFAPNGIGAREADGFRVTGRWQWGSGTQHCRWILGGARCDDDIHRLCFFEADDVELHDTWFTSGMRGSGSLDFSVEGAWVPERRTVRPGVTRPFVESPLAQFPNFTLLAAGVAAVGLGIGRRALDELVAVAVDKTPQFARRTLAASSYTQIEVARAEATLRAARAFLFDELQQAWDVARRGDPVPVAARTGIRLAAAHAASTGAAVADVAFTLAGGTAVYDSSVLGRCQRDAHVVTQHIMTAPKLNETLGKLLLGVDTDTTML
jgi:alkylation response protein AidB-like acyl-CoA dehydrogenase